MLYLVLSVFSSAMISVVMRYSQGRVKAPISLLAMNYLVCCISGLCFIEYGSWLPKGQGSGLTYALGGINGFIYVASLVLTQFNIRKNGVVLSSVFSKIGDLLVPFVMAVCIFGERPAVVQLFGAALAIVGIVAMNYVRGQGTPGAMTWLLMLFAADGMAGAMSKIYGAVDGSLPSHFLVFTFGMALILCLVLVLVRKERPGLPELFFGALIGIPNYFSSRFLLWALNDIPAVVAYPMRSVGSIMVVAMAGLFLFKEKLRPSQWAAIGVILAAVALLSL